MQADEQEVWDAELCNHVLSFVLVALTSPEADGNAALRKQFAQRMLHCGETNGLHGWLVHSFCVLVWPWCRRESYFWPEPNACSLSRHFFSCAGLRRAATRLSVLADPYITTVGGWHCMHCVYLVQDCLSVVIPSDIIMGCL